MTSKRMVSLDGHLFSHEPNAEGNLVAHAFTIAQASKSGGPLDTLCGAPIGLRRWMSRVYADEACEACLNEFTARQLAVENGRRAGAGTRPEPLGRERDAAPQVSTAPEGAHMKGLSQ